MHRDQPVCIFAVSSSLALLQHLLNVRVHPILAQCLGRHVRGTTDPAFALLRTAGALERLVHVPLGTGVEEGEGIADAQRLLIDDAHLHATHVEDEAGGAGVVAEDEVGVQLDVAVATGLDAGVGLFGGGGADDLGEEGAGGEVDQSSGAAAEGFDAAIDIETVGMRRRGEFVLQGRDGGEGFCGGGHGGENGGGGGDEDGGGGEKKKKKKRIEEEKK